MTSEFEKYRNGSEYEFFGRAVACTRAERGLKRKDLVERVGMSTQYLAEIENGGKMPSARMLNHLAEALHTTSSALLSRAQRLEAEDRAGWQPGWPARTTLGDCR